MAGRTQALKWIALLFFLILVAQHEVQADTDCARKCPALCDTKGKSIFQCYLYCIKHCSSGNDGVKLTKEEEKQLESDNGAMLSDIEQQLIHSPHHKLEKDYEGKLIKSHPNQPKEVQGHKKIFKVEKYPDAQASRV